MVGNHTQADGIHILLVDNLYHMGCHPLQDQERSYVPSIHRRSIDMRSTHRPGDIHEHVAHPRHGGGRMGCIGDAADVYDPGILSAIYHHGASVQWIAVAILSAHDYLQLVREEIKTHASVGPCVDPCLWHSDVGRWSFPWFVQLG